MVTTQEVVLAAVTVLLGVTGLVLYFVVIAKYRTAAHPAWPIFNPKHWVGFSKQREWFTPTGYRMYIWSYVLVIVAVASNAVRLWLL